MPPSSTGSSKAGPQPWRRFGPPGSFQKSFGIKCGGNGLELVLEVSHDKLIDQPGLLDLRCMTAVGNDDLAYFENLVGRPDCAWNVGEHLVARTPDHQR